MKRVMALGLMLAGSLSLPVMAQGSLKLEWKNPEKFRDIRPANQSRQSFREEVFSQLQKYIELRLVNRLADGYSLHLTVTDLDLAGEVWPAMMVGLNGGSDVRLIKQIDSPRMAFDFQLLDASGQVVLEGSEDIRDMSFMDRGSLVRDTDPLRYEKNLLRVWFDKALAAYIQK